MVGSCFRLFYCSRLDSANVGGHVGGGGLVFEVFWVVFNALVVYFGRALRWVHLIVLDIMLWKCGKC